MIEYAVGLGLPRDAFVACLDGHRFADAVDRDVADARALGVNATPTFFINGKPLVGAHPVETFRAVIDEALAARR